MVLNSVSDNEMNFIAGGASAWESGYTRRPSRKFFVGASGLPSTSRPRRISQLIRDGDVETKYPSGTGPSYPAGRIRYLPPFPRSGPGRPMSVMNRNQASLTVPGPQPGGISTTV